MTLRGRLLAGLDLGGKTNAAKGIEGAQYSRCNPTQEHCISTTNPLQRLSVASTTDTPQSKVAANDRIEMDSKFDGDGRSPTRNVSTRSYVARFDQRHGVPDLSLRKEDESGFDTDVGVGTLFSTPPPEVRRAERTKRHTPVFPMPESLFDRDVGVLTPRRLPYCDPQTNPQSQPSLLIRLDPQMSSRSLTTIGE